MNNFLKSFLIYAGVACVILLTGWMIFHMVKIQKKNSVLSEMSLTLEKRQAELIKDIEIQKKINDYRNTIEGKLKTARDAGYQKEGEEVYVFSAYEENYDKIQEQVVITSPAEEWFAVFFK